MKLNIFTLAERPEYRDQMETMADSWPEFSRWDIMSRVFYQLAPQLFPEYLLVCEDADKPGELIAKAYSAPIRVIDNELPDDGWDYILRSAVCTRVQGVVPNAVASVEIVIRPDYHKRGVSEQMLRAMRRNVARFGFTELLAAVCPSGPKDPNLPMQQYACLTRDDGLPLDPWLRVHVRVGGVIEKVVSRSMVVVGTLADWRKWTRLPFDTSGPVMVPGGLTPIMCDVEHDYAIYVEPNIWVRHSLADL